jgi:hypothetical protein
MAISAMAAQRAPTQLALPVSAWLLQEMGTQILGEVITRCAEQAIPVLPVKGVVTSRVLYGDVAERPMTDVDVRVRPRDLPRFRRVAAAAGWRCLRVAWSYGNVTYDFGSLSLDVEAGVGPPGVCALRVETMLDRSEHREITPGLWVRVPEIHDHAVLLVVNAFKDKIVTAPPWALTDLERIVALPQFRREIFVERAIQSRVATIVWVVAAWMQSARGSDAWGTIGADLESGGHVRRIYARLFHGQLAKAKRAPMFLRVLARVGADSLQMQIGAIARAAAWGAEQRLRSGRA